MCGIVGLWNHRNDELLREMAERIRHRGPDSDGFFCTDAVGLGMRRLAVIDLKSGDQPVFNEDKSVVVVYNGEIYNFRELRENLLKNGHIFRTQTDTEVLVHLYEEEGPAFVKRLNGMFAFALWDERNKRLMLARDPLGIKPLYHTEWQGKMAFSSELKCLLCLPALSREVNPLALGQYLSRGSIPAPLSVFNAINKLPAAHVLVADEHGVKIERYWTVPTPEPGQHSPSLGELEQLLESAVKSQMVSDVPLGVFLSGGLDSSALVTYASRYAAGRLKTFSIGYQAPDQSYNELDKARLVAKKFGCDHREFILSPDIHFLCSLALEERQEGSTVPLTNVTYITQTKIINHGGGSFSRLPTGNRKIK